MTRTPAPGETMLPQTLGRLHAVDILRGLSILAVVLLHLRLRFWFAGFWPHPHLPYGMFTLLFSNGSNGVTVFFCISGFLITLTSLHRFGTLGAMRPRTFYRIRFARIAPLLLLVLAVLSVLHLAHVDGFVIHRNDQTLRRALLAALTFTLNRYEAVHGYLPACWDVLWSLSVEEAFYLLFPLVCLGLLARGRGGRLGFAVLMAGLLLAGPFARVLPTNEIWQEKTYLGGTDGIAFGCLTALLYERLQRVGRPAWMRPHRRLLALQLSGAAVMLFIATWPRWHWLHPAVHLLGRSGLDTTLLELATCAVILAASLRGVGGGAAWLPLRWMGRHSYELYLTHEFVVIGVTAIYLHWHHGPIWAWIVAAVLLMLPLGWATARWFSEPMNRRLRGARPPAARSAAQG